MDFLNKKKKTGRLVLARAIADIALFSAAASLPWPITFLAALSLSFKFKRYWEAPAAGLFIDILFYYPDFRVFGTFNARITTFLIFLTAFILTESAKKYLKV